jgi:hypothetical protein
MMALLIAAIAAADVREELSVLLIALFFAARLRSATHESAVEGFDLIALDKHTQALLSDCADLLPARLDFGAGGLVLLAGYIEVLHARTADRCSYALFSRRRRWR